MELDKLHIEINLTLMADNFHFVRCWYSDFLCFAFRDHYESFGVFLGYCLALSGSL